MEIEKLKLLVGFVQFFLASVVVTLATFWVNSGFKDREIAISEHQYLVQFKDDALNEDIEVRRRLAEYFSKVTMGKEMRQGWLDYLELIEGKKRTQAENVKQIALLQEQLKSSDSGEELNRLRAELTQAKARESQLAVELGRVAELANLVDCLLPGQLRTLGSRVYSTPRRPVRTNEEDCRIRGGEYVPTDQATLQSSLSIWLPVAETGDSEAQVIVGEIYERGQDGNPDYENAAKWYRHAAEQGNSQAQFNLGTLYEQGLGVARDEVEALNWYRKSKGISASSVVLEKIDSN